MATTFPFGYGTTRLTLDQLVGQRTVARLNPEFRRRLLALMVEAARQGISLGIGTGWRIQPNPPPPGFASPGNSNHESFPAGSNTATAVAADMVPSTAWTWMDRNALRFGLRTFKKLGVSSPDYTGVAEAWHIQPSDIPYARSWRKDPWSLRTFPLPGAPAPAPAPNPVPPASQETVVIQFKGRVLRPDANAQTGYDVVVLQGLLNTLFAAGLKVDGSYGLVTIARVQDAQRKLSETPDGVVGPVTWTRLLNG
ncbi:MAG: peptidoglycan-binding protein [Geodermatophilaceae bacterium]|nr:peptidoglycan-binding protein [Geodermatophilaceae bacterium]